jgi:very-short-patch-repair endonuclease
LEGAIREAEYLHRFQVESLEELLDRHPGRRGAKSIKACLHRLGRGPRGHTRSAFEARFAALLADTELPKPELNALLDLDGFKIEADCLWRERRLILELDGGKAHRTRSAFESDRERDRRLQAAGWRVVRVTWRQMDHPAALLADLRRLLLSSNLHFPAI